MNALATLLVAVLDQSTDYAVIALTPDGTITAWGGAAQRTFGYDTSEVVGRPFSMLFTREDVALQQDLQEINLATASGRSEDDRWHLRKDGNRFWGSGVMMALRDEDGRVVQICKLMRDKTDVRTRIEQLENQLAAREAEIARQCAVVAATTHELRNRIGPITLALALLRSATTTPTANVPIEVLERQVEVLTTVVDDMWSSVLMARPRPLARVQLDLCEALRRCHRALEPLSRGAGQMMRLVVPGVALWVDGDPPRIDQILHNLVGNAMKYTPPGGEISLSLSVEANTAVVRVEDTGIGIASEVLPHIFELFTREHRGLLVDGLGVGLAVVRHLASLHGGTVEARSAGPGKGSLFALRLPLAPPARTVG